MRWILLQLAKLARLRRRVLGKKTPHWFSDATGLIGYVNVFSVGLAIFAMASVPGHFFVRLPQYIQRRKSWLPTPLKFFTSSVTLMVTVLAASNNFDPPGTIHMSEGTTRLVVSGFFLFAPFIMAALCAFLIPFDLFLSLVFSRRPADFLRLPLCLSTYTSLDPSRYLWSMLYFGVHNFIIWQFLFFVGFFSWVTSRWVVAVEPNSSILWGLPVHVAIWAPFAMLSGFFLILPYNALLLSCMRIPTKLILRMDLDDLRTAIIAFEQMAQSSRWEDIERHVPTLRSHVEYFSALNQNAYFGKQVPAKLVVRFNKNRHSLYSKMLDTSRLRSLVAAGPLAVSVKTEFSSLLDQLDRERMIPT